MEQSSHDKKEQKRQQKEQANQEQKVHKSKKELKSKIIKYSITAAILIIIIVGGYFLIIKPIKGFKPYYGGQYHWHANFAVSICGQPAQIRCSSSLCGPMTLHHHNDDIIHIEGNTIAKPEDIALGRFFEGIGLEFSETSLLGKNNGDLCPSGQAGNVKMYIDGEENNEFSNYILKRCDAQSTTQIRQQCEKIEIRFD